MKTNIDYKGVGYRIGLRRKEMRLKQNELAEAADLSNNYLSNIENGHSIPSLETFVNLCIALKVTPDYLLLGNMRKSNTPLNTLDALKLCDDETLSLICDIIPIILEHRKR